MSNEGAIIAKQTEISTWTHLKSDIDAEYFDDLISARNASCDNACSLAKYGCFPAGTPIVTESKNIPIEHIKVDDKVLSFNHQTNRPEVKKVTSIKSYLVCAIMALVFHTGDTLWATPNHPFWYKDHYVEAASLHAGDVLTALDGGTEVITHTFTKDTAIRVYNFTVEDNHNYYVGSPGVLVHNDCFLDRIKHSPGLVAAIDELPKGLKGKFIEDFKKAGNTDGSIFQRFITGVNELIYKKIGGYVEAIAVSQKIAKNVWEEGTINKSTWHSTGDEASEHNQWPSYAQIHPLTGGGVDGVIDEIVGIPMAIKGVYGIMTDAQQREALKGLFTKEGMSALISGLIKEADDIANDEERAQHFASQTTVSVAAAFTGIGLITKTGKVGEVLETATQGVKNGIKNSKVAKVLTDLRVKPKYFAPRHQTITDFLQGLDAPTLNKLADKIGFDKVIQEMSYSWKKHHAGKFLKNNIKGKGDEFIENILST